MSKVTIRATIGGRIVAFYPVLARVAGSVSGGVWLSQLLYWDAHMAEDRGDNWDGWFYKSDREFRIETEVTRYEMDQARAALKGKGIIETTARGVPMTTHYRVNFEKLEVEIEHAETAMVAERRAHKVRSKPPQFADLRQTQFADCKQTGLQTVNELDSRLSANKNANSEQTIHKITQEITQKSTKKDEQESLEAIKPFQLTVAQLWHSARAELQCQMTKSTFDTHIVGTEPVSLEDGILTISTRRELSLYWLRERLKDTIERTLYHCAGGKIEARFILRQRDSVIGKRED